MQLPESIYMPPNAREQIRAILPFATDFRLRAAGGWVIRFQMKEDHSNWDLDKKFLAENNLTLEWEIEKARFDEIRGPVGPDTIMFELTYKP